MKGLLYCAFALSLISCSSVRHSNPVTLSGHFSIHKGQPQLLRCGDAQRFAVEDPAALLKPAYAELLSPVPAAEASTYAVLRGYKSNKNTLRVLRVDTLTRLGIAGGCLPYEFYASGTEPFWTVRISPTEGIVYTSLADNASVWWPFERAAQSAQGNSWAYKTHTDGKTLQLVIQKETCSDGMSDIAHLYKATLTVQGQVLHGCARRWGEPLPAER